MSHHYGVFYPLQSLRKDVDELPDIPVFIDASDEGTRKKLEQLARSISGKKSSSLVTRATEITCRRGDRKQLHQSFV